MMPHEPVRDIMRRTVFNLEFVERHAGAHGPFEVTQLINSFMGALAHPWECYREDLKSLRPDAMVEWPMPTKERPTEHDPDSVGDVVRLLRNGIVHGNVEYLAGDRGDIRALRIWNVRDGRRTWGTILTVEDLRKFLCQFVALAELLVEAERRARSRTA